MSCLCVIVTKATLRKSQLTPYREKSVINNRSSIVTCSAINLILISKISSATAACCFPSQCRFTVLHTKRQQSQMRQVKNINVTSKYAENLSGFLSNKGVFGFSSASLYCFHTAPSERFYCKYQLIVSFHGSLSTIAAGEIKPVTFLL